MYLIIYLLSLFIYTQANPQFPQWPNKFSQAFNETFAYGPIKSSTSGIFYYDFDNKTYKISRENGHYDRYCGTNGKYAFLNTKCEHIVANGDRFLHYPDKKECCYCCSSSHGCGILKPDWLNNALFVGETEFEGQKVYKWNQKGLQDNFYYETIAENPKDRIMLSIDQVPNDIQKYENVRNLNFESIILPEICQKSKQCSFFSVCTTLRG